MFKHMLSKCSKKILRKTNLPHGSDHRWALNRSIIGFELSWNHKRLTKTFPRRELTCFTKQTLGMYRLGEHLSWLEFHMHSFWMFKRVSTILKSWEAHEDVLQERIEFSGGEGGVCIEKSIPRGGGGGPIEKSIPRGRGWIEQSIIWPGRADTCFARQTQGIP